MKNEPNKVISVSFDGCLKVVDLESKTVKKSFKVCDLALSACQVIKEDEVYAVKYFPISHTLTYNSDSSLVVMIIMFTFSI